jgi:hypothetical protein
MIDDMGIFRMTIEVAAHGAPDDRATLLGAHGLEALNLRVDFGRKELVPAGPAPVAVAA